MKSINSLIEEISIDLRLSNFLREADEISELLRIKDATTSTKEEKIMALEKIKEMTNIRWLGDLYLPHLKQNQWWKKLENLSRVADLNIKHYNV